MTWPLQLRRLRWLAGVALLAACAAAQAADVFVIANASVELTPEEVKEIFLGEVQFAGSMKLLPVDNASVQADFVARVLRMSVTKYQGAWTKKAFRDGLNPPPMKASDAEVIGFVKASPGAIGYVSTPPIGVKIVGRF